MNITFNLESILKDLEISKNHLAVESKTRPATVLYLAQGKIQRVDINMLSKVLDTLNRIAKDKGINKTYTIDDVLKYEYKDS